MDITLQFSKLAAQVNRSLAIIAKRSHNEKGEPAYSHITLSTAEMPLLNDYFRDAIVMLTTQQQYFVVNNTFTDESESPVVTLSFPANHNNKMDSSLAIAVTSFCVSYALWAWFSVTEPKLVERYQQEMKDKLANIIQIIWHKAPPEIVYDMTTPASVNTPGDITLANREQRLFSYTLGSNGQDRIYVSSSSERVIVTKNPSSKTISVINVREAGDTDTITAVVTVKESVDGNVIGTFNVTALPPAAGVTVDPVIIGFGAVSDTITLHKGENTIINYVGVISSAESSDDSVATVTTEGVGKYRLTAKEVNSCVITFHAESGWTYRLSVNVIAVESTSPSINFISPVTVTVGQTLEFGYTLGSNQVSDDFIISVSNGKVSVVKDTANKKFIITGLSIGTDRIVIASVAYPLVRAEINVSVLQGEGEQDVQPQIYGYKNGDTIPWNIEEAGDTLIIRFYAGSRGGMAISASNDKAQVTYTENAATVKMVKEGTCVIYFNNDEMNWSAVLILSISNESVQITYPTLSYIVGTASATNHPTTLTSQSVDLSTDEDITVYVDAQNEDMLRRENLDVGNATVTKKGAGVYVIHPITGVARIKFSYGDWSRTIKVTYVKSSTAHPEVLGYTDEATGNYVNIPSGNSMYGLTMYDNNSIILSVDETEATAIIEPDDPEVITVDRIGLGQGTGSLIRLIPVGTGNCDVILTTENNNWSFRLRVEVLEATNPTLEYSNKGSDYNELTDSTVSIATDDTVYVRISGGSGSTLEVNNSSPLTCRVERLGWSPSSKDYAIGVTSGTADVTFKYGRWQKVIHVRYVGSAVEPGEEPTPTLSPRIVDSSVDDNYDERTVNVGASDDVSIANDTISSAWSTDTRKVLVSYNQGESRLRVDGIEATISPVTVKIRTTNAPSSSPNLLIAYTVIGSVPDPSVYGSTAREIAADYSGEYIDILNGTISNVSSSDSSVISESSHNSTRVYLTPHAVGTAVITIETNQGINLTVDYTVVAAKVWPSATTQGSGYNTAGMRTLNIGMTDTVTINDATIVNVYGQGDNAVSWSRNGNVITIRGEAATQSTVVYVQIAEETISGENVIYLPYRVNAPTVENRYRNLNEGDSDSFVVSNATVDGVTAEPSGVVTLQRTGNTVNVTADTGSQSGNAVAVKVACNNYPAAEISLNYKVWPAAQHVSELPEGVTREEPPSPTSMEWVNKSDTPIIPKTFLTLCAGIPMTDQYGTDYVQPYVIVRLMYDETLGKYVVRPTARNVADKGQYFYFIRTSSGTQETQAPIRTEVTQLIANMAKLALTQYGFTGDNEVVAGDILLLPYSGSDAFPWPVGHINIP